MKNVIIKLRVTKKYNFMKVVIEIIINIIIEKIGDMRRIEIVINVVLEIIIVMKLYNFMSVTAIFIIYVSNLAELFIYYQFTVAIRVNVSFIYLFGTFFAVVKYFPINQIHFLKYLSIPHYP